MTTTEIFKIGRVQFAQEDYQLLVGSFLVIFAVLIISYFALFVENPNQSEEKSEEQVEQVSQQTQEESQPAAADNSNEPAPHQSPVKSATPAKSPVRSPVRPVEEARNSPVPRHSPVPQQAQESVIEAKSPVRPAVGSNNDDEQEHDDAPVTPAPGRRGRKAKQAPPTEDVSQLLSPEGRRTSLRLKKRKEDSY